MSQNNIYIAIDLSLRSTAVVALDRDGNVLDQKIIAEKKLDDEALLLYNNSQIMGFINSVRYLGFAADEFEVWPVKAVAIERPSYNSKSNSTDLISANHWFTRVSIVQNYPTAKLKITSVTEWRSKVISDVEARLINDSAPVIRAKKGLKLTKDETKDNNRNKKLRKKATKELTVKKLPEDVKKSFDKYIKSAKLKDTAMYDLADAYFICRHLMNLEKS